MRCAKVAALCALCMASACTKTKMPATYHAGAARERRGDLGGALRDYQTALGECPDDEGCAAIAQRIGETYVRLGKHVQALSWYRRMARSQRYPIATVARAQHRVARLHEARANLAAAQMAYRKTIRHYPREAAAEDALADIARILKPRPATLLQLLTALLNERAVAPLHDHIAFCAATTLRDQGKPRRAVTILDRLVTDFPRSVFWDDALYLAAELLAANQRPQAAILRYRRLLSRREYAFKIGSYLSVKMDNAQLQLARLLLRVGKTDRALHEFKLLRDDFRDSVLRDDASLAIARLHRRRGNGRAACTEIGVLLRRFRDSNSAVRGRHLRVKWGC